MEHAQLIDNDDRGGAHEAGAALPRRDDLAAPPGACLARVRRSLGRVRLLHLVVATQAPPDNQPGGEGALEAVVGLENQDAPAHGHMVEAGHDQQRRLPGLHAAPDRHLLERGVVHRVKDINPGG